MALSLPDEETFAAIVADIAEGMSLSKALRAHSVNPRYFFEAKRRNPEWERQYQQAQHIRIEIQADDLEDTAASALGMPAEGVNAVRLIVDTKKWMYAIQHPEKFGARVRNELVGADGGPIAIQALPPLESIRQTMRARLVEVPATPKLPAEKK